MRRLGILILTVLYIFTLCGCKNAGLQNPATEPLNDSTTAATDGPAPTDGTDPGDATVPTEDAPPTDATDGENLCDHAWGQWTEITPATCGHAGEKERLCGRCGEAERLEIPALEHEESDWIVDRVATEQETGHR